MIDYDRHLRADSQRFRQVMGGLDPDVAIPSCPEWDAAELLWHLAEVQMFWGLIVEHRLTDPERTEEMQAARPVSYRELLELYDRESSRLVEALESAPDEATVWTWSDDESVAFVRRRQAHEALIHRVDAELAAGLESVVDAELAADGIDEVLSAFVGGIPGWASFEPDGTTVRLDATDARRVWHLALGRMTGTSPNTGTAYDLAALVVVDDPAAPDALIAGSAVDLDLWLWGRGPLTAVTGDDSLAERLRGMIAESAQ